MCDLPATNREQFLDLSHYLQTELTKSSCFDSATAAWLTQNTTTHSTAVRGQLLVIIDQNPLCIFRDQPQQPDQQQQFVTSTNYVDQLSQADSLSPEPLLDLDLDLDDLDITDIKNLLHRHESSTIDIEQLNGLTTQNIAPTTAKTLAQNTAKFGEVYDDLEGTTYSLYSDNNNSVVVDNHNYNQQQQQEIPAKRSRRIGCRPPGFKQTTEYIECRARNNVAVKRCREQQRRRLDETEQQVKQLQHENNKLKQLVSTLQAENLRLTLGGATRNPDIDWSGLF